MALEQPGHEPVSRAARPAMIVSRGRRLIFIHVPKTAGTALTLALEARAMADDILIGDTPKARARHRRQKADPRTAGLRKHSMLQDLAPLVPDLSGWFVLTTVRNPWDRAVSYYHWLRAQSFRHPAVTLAQTLDFAAFLAHPQTAGAFRAAPYGAYVQDAAGVERCTLFARVERLDTDLAPLEAHLGFRLTPLPRANASVREADYRRAYTAVTADLVADYCAQDIARFGYTFDPEG